mgnify:CR=1 FL=1
MSFSADVKGELARLDVKKKEDMLAEISGFLRVAGSIRIKGGGKISIVASTENPAIARHYKKLIKEYFGSTSELEIGESEAPSRGKNKSGGYRYSLTISHESKSDRILRETGILMIKEGDDYLSDGIFQPIVARKSAKKAYLRGIFLGCGTISDPKKSYHLEFVIKREGLAQDLKKLIDSFDDMKANLSKRNNKIILYIKKADHISDMLGIMGADSAVMTFENIRLERRIKGEAMRLSNCDNANVDRVISAAERQLRDIELIDRIIGINNLPDPLREVAYTRLDNPSLSLTEIGNSLGVPIGKSAVTKRFNKIREIANNLDGSIKKGN